jgi:hypothetical protein
MPLGCRCRERNEAGEGRDDGLLGAIPGDVDPARVEPNGVLLGHILVRPGMRGLGHWLPCKPCSILASAGPDQADPGNSSCIRDLQFELEWNVGRSGDHKRTPVSDRSEIVHAIGSPVISLANHPSNDVGKCSADRRSGMAERMHEILRLRSALLYEGKLV